ncbi:hypothetical protein CLAIMM_13335 [Cladophialophora immunda]|nr:hypothetical protein CLAIMM_13335 [Cladophialophora immunda]
MSGQSVGVGYGAKTFIRFTQLHNIIRFPWGVPFPSLLSFLSLPPTLCVDTVASRYYAGEGCSSAAMFHCLVN